MTAERFAQIERIFDQARAVPRDERAALLDSLCAGDAELRAEVEALLAHEVPTPKPLVGRLTEAMSRDGQASRKHPPSSASDLTGQDVGPYKVERVLGRGGMGVVYLAHDAQLQRHVAIKTLPSELLDHTARADRFLREAQLLASLKHPNVATVYGLEQCGSGGTCLVLELVDGESLAQRLAEGPLTIETSLDVCRQIAAGVEAAHAAGVIHRDLKPPNVMIDRDGGVKVLDFGLARSIDPPPGSGSRGAGRSPAKVETQAGAAIGTPGYMSPEQLRGEADVDKRTDVFALGCILYECLTGQVAFAGTSAADAAASVLEREPDWSRLPAKTPRSIRRLLQRCLAKDRGQRLRDVGDARLELEDALDAREWTATSTTSPAPPAPMGRKWIAAAMLLVAIAAVALIVATLRPRRAQTPGAGGAVAPFQRFSVAFPENAEQADLTHVRLALSRDGSRLVVSGTDGKQNGLFLRERDTGVFRAVEGTENAWIPSFSPDGQWIAYFDSGAMRKRPLAGGNPVRVSEVQGYWSQYSWSNDGYLAHIPYWSRGVARIHNEGGKPEFLTQPDNAAGEFAHVTPITLADGSALLYMVWDGGSGTRIDAIDIKTRTKRNVVPDGACPKVANTPGGTYLLWVRSGTIYAAPFDPVALKRTGPEVPLAERVLYDRVLFVASYDVSDDGTLAYVPGPMFVEESRFAWVEPGSSEPAAPLNDERMGFGEPTFSADGNLLSFIIKSDVFKPALYDLRAGTLKRIVTDGDCESCAVSRDGRFYAYCSNKEGTYDVYVRDLATEAERKVFKGPGDYPNTITWSPDDKQIAFGTTPNDHSQRDVYIVNVADGTFEVFCNTKGEERSPRWSPDGKWLAYSSDEGGTREVYVRSYPDKRVTRQVSVEGGDWPHWDPKGSRLYYRAQGKLWAASIAADGSVSGRPQVVYDKRFGQGNFDSPDYTVHPDGRLLLVEPSERGPKVNRIDFLLNWHNLPQIRGAR